jgi:hypothetical protein
MGTSDPVAVQLDEKLVTVPPVQDNLPYALAIIIRI